MYKKITFNDLNDNLLKTEEEKIINYDIIKSYTYLFL